MHQIKRYYISYCLVTFIYKYISYFDKFKTPKWLEILWNNTSPYIYIYIYIYLNVVDEEKVGMKKTIFLFNVNSYKNSFSFLEICCKIKKKIYMWICQLHFVYLYIGLMNSKARTPDISSTVLSLVHLNICCLFTIRSQVTRSA